MIEVLKNSVSHTEYFVLTDPSGWPKRGIMSKDIMVTFVRARGIPQVLRTLDLAKPDSGFSPGGWKEIDALRQPGLYRFDIPNNAFYSGTPDRLIFTVVAEGCRPEHKEYILI